jgi:hypothetical protein
MTPYEDSPEVQVDNLFVFMDYVKAGGRPKMPRDAPDWYAALINSCWATDTNARPSFERIVSVLEEEMQAEGIGLEGLVQTPQTPTSRGVGSSVIGKVIASFGGLQTSVSMQRLNGTQERLLDST